MHWDHEPWKAPASRTHSKRFAKSQALGHCAAAFGVRGACSRFRARFMERQQRAANVCLAVPGSTRSVARLAGKPRTKFIGFSLYSLLALLPVVSLAQFTGGPPVITKEPQSQFVAAGTNVTFSVVIAESYTQLNYQWRLKSGVEPARATNSTLVITNAALSDGGNYYVVVANAA